MSLQEILDIGETIGDDATSWDAKEELLFRLLSEGSRCVAGLITAVDHAGGNAQNWFEVREMVRPYLLQFASEEALPIIEHLQKDKDALYFIEILAETNISHAIEPIIEVINRDIAKTKWYSKLFADKPGYVRVKYIEALGKFKTPRVRDFLLEKQKSDPFYYVRLACESILKQYKLP